MQVLNNILKWTGMALVIAGALCTSLRIDPLNIMLLNLGALVYMIWAMRIREMNLVIVNAVLLAIYAIGLLGVPGPL
jgi:hypothetical protein